MNSKTKTILYLVIFILLIIGASVTVIFRKITLAYFGQ